MSEAKVTKVKVNVKKNDQVLVTTGKDRGARGRVLRVLASDGKAIVERVNMIKRHTRPNPNKGIQGGILEREAPIQISNLKVICPECGKPRASAASGSTTGVACGSARLAAPPLARGDSDNGERSEEEGQGRQGAEGGSGAVRPGARDP